MNNKTLYYSAIVAVSAVMLLCAYGCAATSISPFSGKKVTAEQLTAEVKAEELKFKREADSVKTDAERQIANANVAQKKAKSTFDRAAAKIQSDASAQLAVLAMELEQSQIDSEQLIAGAIAETTAKMAEIDARRESTAESAKLTLAEIEAKQAKYETILSVGQTIASGFGPFGGIAAGAIGLGGVLFGMSKKKDAQAIHETAGRIVDAIDMLKDKRPEVAEAFKSESEFIKSWMGQSAISFVDKVQKS